LKLLKRAISLIAALAILIGLLPTVRLTAAAAESLTVGDTYLHASHAADGVTVDGKMDEALWRRTISLGGSLKVSAAWDWKNLYLAFSDTTAPTVTELKINGKTVSAQGTASETAREIQVSLAELEIGTSDLSGSYSLFFKVGDVTWEGKLVLDTSVYASTAPKKRETWGPETSSDGWTVNLNTYTGSNDTAQWRDLYWPVMESLQASLTAPTILEMDITVNYLPDGAVLNYTDATKNGGRDFLMGGLNITVADGTTLATASSTTEALLTGLYKDGTDLKLVYWDNANGQWVSKTIDTYTAGKQYHLRMEYSYTAGAAANIKENDTPNNDLVAVRYFVNGKLVVAAENVKRNGSYGVSNATQILLLTQNISTAVDEATSTDVTVSNLSAVHTQELEAPAGVGDNFLHAAYATDILEDGKLTESAWRLNIPLSQYLELGAAWDWSNLYLGLRNNTTANNNAASSLSALEINGKTLYIDGSFDANTREICVPLSQIGITDPDFSATYPISLTVSGITWEGDLIFDTNNYAVRSGSAAYGTPLSNNNTVASFATSGSTYSAGNKQYFGFSNVTELAASAEVPTIVEFDVEIDQIPTGGSLPTNLTALNRDFCKGGIGVTILDDDPALVSGKATEAFQLGIYRNTSGELQFTYWANGAYHSIALAETPSSDYHVRVEYSYASDGSVSAVYFVNGVMIAEGRNVKATTSTNFSATTGNFIMVLAAGTASADEYKTVKEKELRAVFSNMSVSKPQPLEKPTDLEPLTPEYVFGRIDLDHVRSDLPLPATFTGKSGTVYDLEWVIGDTDLVSTAGKVNRPESAAKSTTITLKVDGNELWTVTVTVDPMSFTDQPSPENVDAAFSASTITVDGVLSEEGWRMSGRVLTNAKILLAEYGFQWNQTTLFAAVDFAGDAQNLSLTLNGKTFTVESGKLMLNGAEVTGAVVAVKDGIVEISVPMSAVGMGDKVSEYGKSMDMTVNAGGFTGAGKKLALTSIDWFATDNREHEAPVSGTKSTDDEHGVSQLENGWRLYDLYKEGGSNNKTDIRSYVIYNKLPVYVDNMSDRVVATRVEFDFLAAKMPLQNEDHLNVGAFANSGFTFSMGDLANENKEGWSTVCGIMNTENGLEFVLQGNQGYVLVPLNKTVGQQFSIAVEWYMDDHMDLFVDGVLVKSLSDVSKYTLGVGNASLCVNMKRVKFAPTGPADDFDVSITNIALGKVYNNDEILNGLTFDDIKGSNISEDKIVSDLVLPTETTNGQLDNKFDIKWTSSNEDVISETGKVTRPDKGVAIVTLTATLSNGVYKRFELIVHGQQVSNEGVLHVVGDINPAVGVGRTYSDLLFTFDDDNNSIIRDLGSKQQVNFAVLTDGDDKARLNAESLTLWVSEDNVTYTQVESFKLLQVDSKWYLYDFEAEGRYIKVHYTHFEGTDANFIGAYGQMIDAGFEEVFGGGQETFTTSEYTLNNNTGKDRYDYAWTISKSDLGITGTDASIRISLNGGLLYHYVDGDNVVVRVPELAKGASVKLTVQQSASSNVMDIANKEGVHEVTYGYRESFTGNRLWVMTLPAGTTFPDGSVLEQETIFGMANNSFRTSTDGGLTWSAVTVFNNAPEGKTPVDKMSGGGWMFDSVTGRIMFQTYHKYKTFNAQNMNDSHMESFVIASDDGGKTWYLLSTLPCACMEEYKDTNVPRYALSYSDGIMLSTYDGADGNGIDFVYPLGTQYDNTGAFATRVAYTRDAGETWHYSETQITYPSKGSEAGCSEAYIAERDDGVLILHVRCQGEGVYHFKVSYSYDHGVTWTNDHVFTDYYASNGQALIKWFEVDGVDTMMSVWQGNNAIGGDSYLRSPLNFAMSIDGGETFRNIQNMAFKTYMEGYDYRWTRYLTNQSVAKFGGDNLIYTYQRSPHSDYVMVLAHDFDQWFTRTKGAYDNFEHGTIQYEGWSVLGGTVELSPDNARDKYSMKVSGNGTSVTRSVPYLQNGQVSVDVFVKENSSFTLSLQCAYSPEYSALATPIRLRVENGSLYLGDSSTAVAVLNNGWNSLTFDLELTEQTAQVAVNGGTPVSIPVNTEAGDYVCYITFGANTEIYVDELLVISDLDVVLDAVDESAVERVEALINAIGHVTLSDETAIEAARAAYEALNEQEKALVSNLDVLIEAEIRLDELKNGGNTVIPVQPSTEPEIPVEPAELNFSDVPATAWYHEAVEYAVLNGLMNGISDTEFGPSNTLNRAMVVTVLWRLEGEPVANYAMSFTDVPAGQWYTEAIRWAASQGIVNGIDARTYAPLNAVTREQLVTILYRYAQKKGYNVSVGEDTNILSYTDAFSISEYAVPAMQWACGAGVINGNDDGSLNPKGNTKRSEFAKVIMNFCENVAE